MHVIGTAGHVDHGKSTLVAALTGIHPDRLKEEQAREMTIDLGFAWMTLPGGEEIGIVDVPGHRDFIENMLAGVGGIDAVLFVVAADEGVMPQTREHLAIVDLLQVKGGVIALTKVDLVDDVEWLDLVEMDVLKAVSGSILENATRVRVSARTGQGLSELKQALSDCLAERPARIDLGRARLPVDRIFSMPGFGTVVTGTLLDGELRLGQEVTILPGQHRGRVRGLQSHKKKEDVALPGSRTAVNISGVDVDQVRRGDVVVKPGFYQPTQRLDVHFHLLSESSSSIRHSSEVKLYLGTAEVLARVRLLGQEDISPGQEGWLQLELQQPLVAVRGDHYILRRPSPSETLGGGVVVDPYPKGRHKRFDTVILQQLETLLVGSPSEVFFQAALALGIASLRDVLKRSRLSEEQAQVAMKELVENGQLVPLESGALLVSSDLLVITHPQWTMLSRSAVQEVKNYHRLYPLRRGIPREELKSRLKLSGRVYNAMMSTWVQKGYLVEKTTVIALPDYKVQFSSSQWSAVERLLQHFTASPYSPPSIKECIAAVGEEVYLGLVEEGELLPVSSEVVFRPGDFDVMLAAVYDHYVNQPTLTVAQFRDKFNTSRRYALAFLEYLDVQGVTVRAGDVRTLRKNQNKR